MPVFSILWKWCHSFKLVRVYNIISNSLFADNFLRLFSADSFNCTESFLITLLYVINRLPLNSGVSGTCSGISVTQKLQARLRLVYVRSEDLPGKGSV